MDYEIVAIDEVSFQLTTNYKRIWFSKGKTPKGAFFWSNKKLIVFGAQIENQKLFYDFFDAQNSLTFLAFLNGLFERLDKNKKYILILDNAGWYKTQVVQKRFEQHKEWIKVEFIPTIQPRTQPNRDRLESHTQRSDKIKIFQNNRGFTRCFRRILE